MGIRDISRIQKVIVSFRYIYVIFSRPTGHYVVNIYCVLSNIASLSYCYYTCELNILDTHIEASVPHSQIRVWRCPPGLCVSCCQVYTLARLTIDSNVHDTIDVSYAAPQVHVIVNVALHRECSPSIIFIFSQERKDLYHV
jgi:hypothetical protein